jgi:hypothetical protein
MKDRPLVNVKNQILRKDAKNNLKTLRIINYGQR